MWGLQLGCTIYEVCMKTPPFTGQTIVELHSNLRAGAYKPMPRCARRRVCCAAGERRRSCSVVPAVPGGLTCLHARSRLLGAASQPHLRTLALAHKDRSDSIGAR